MTPTVYTYQPRHAQRFGRWLSAELARRDSSGPKLATALGLQRPTVYRWTSGRYRPEAAICPAIAEALGVEPDLVLDMAGYRAYDLATAGAVRRELTELIATIPEELLRPLVPMLRGLAESAATERAPTGLGDARRERIAG